MTTSTQPEPFKEPGFPDGNINAIPTTSSDAAPIGGETAGAVPQQNQGLDLPPSELSAAANPAGEEADHNMAVEKYLAELLGRHGSEPNAAVVEAAVLAEVAGSPALANEPEATGPAEANVDAVSEESSEPAPRKKTPVRQVAPADMSAMREIANCAARRAIATHTKKQLVTAAYGKLILAGLALATSYGLIQMSTVVSTWTYGLAVIALGVGGYLAWQYLRMAGELSDTQSQATPVSENPEPLADAAETVGVQPEATAEAVTADVVPTVDVEGLETAEIANTTE